MSKIIGLELIDISVPLRTPYQIAYEVISHSPNLLLILKTSDGLTGYGCATPDFEIGGETAETVKQFYYKTVEPLLYGSNPFRIHHIMAQLRALHVDQPSLLAMVDQALYDLLAKRAKLPVYQLLGGYRTSIPTSVTIGILPLIETLAEGERLAKQGFSIFKIKGGISVDLDIERVFKFREQFGKNILLRFDANQGYSVSDTIRFVQATLDSDIEILEQPGPKKELQQMGMVTQQVDLPVMADESLMNLGDAFRIARNGLANMFNIKLMKVGGITHASHINSVAKAAGMETMIGCMDECALGICSGLHFALAYPNVKYADLDGHLELMDDPTAGCFDLKDGVLYPKDEVGWGMELREKISSSV